MSNVIYFANKFKNKSKEELTQVVENPNNYQEPAVIAARQLLINLGEQVPEEIEVEDATLPDQFSHTVYKIPVVSRTHRFVHYLVDFIVIFLLTMVSMEFFLIGAWYSELSLGSFMIKLNSYNFYLIMLAYYLIFETTIHKTLGKYITKTIVVDDDGHFLSTQHMFIRTICRLIPFEGFSCLVNPSIGWHDRFSKSYVIYEDELDSFRNRYNQDAISDHLITDTT